jgi:hypothetical protein
MPVVSVTRLRVRSSRYLLPFIFQTARAVWQAKRSQGNLGVGLLRDADSTFWTRTVWTTDADVKLFMLAAPHRQAMRRLLEWCDEASLVRWEQATSEAPNWQEAHRRLQAEGRRSKVNHPSPAHEAFQIRAPRVR